MTRAHRWIGGLTVAAMGLATLTWLVVALGGLSEMEHVPEQGGCYQPNVVAGIGILAIAAGGVGASAWTLHTALSVARGRRNGWGFALGLGAVVLLAGALVAFVLLFARGDDFGPCPSP